MSTRPARGRLAAALAFVWGAAAFASAATETRTGTIQILTADDFESETAERIVAVVSDRGEMTLLKLPAGAATPEAGARVAVHGAPRGKDELDVETVEVLAPAPSETPSISGNSTVIAILLKFSDTTTEPFTVA